MVARHGGEILYTERWPDRKLAYEIKGRRKGTYFLTYFKADGSAVAPLRREAQLSERILRVLVLKNDQALEEIEKRREAQKKSVPPAETAPAGSSPAGDETEEFVEEEIAEVGEGAAVSEEQSAESVTEEEKEKSATAEAETDSVASGEDSSAEEAPAEESEEEKRSDEET